MSDTSGEGGQFAASETTSTDEISTAIDDAKRASAVGETSDPITEPVGAQPSDNEDLADTDVLPTSRDDDDDTDVLPAVPSSDSTTAERRVTDNLAKPQGWEPLDELERALSTGYGSQHVDDEQTLEIDSVYARARLRRAARQTGGADAADALDPFEVTGLRIAVDGDASSEAFVDESPSTGRFARPSQGGSAPDDRAEALQPPRDWSGTVSVGLDGHDGELLLRAPWAQWVEELRQETSAEGDAELRSSYIYLLANTLRLFGGLGRQAAARLEEAGTQTSQPVRSLLVDLVVKHWEEPDERFFDALERLEAWDAREELEAAGVRRASIVAERLLAGGLDGEVERRLEQQLSPPETLPGLVLRGIRAHQSGHRGRAAQIWRQVSRHLRDEPRVVLVDASAFFLRGTPGFFDYVQQRLDSGSPSRTLLVMMQREAAAVGDHLREAVALRQLVAADVALGRRLRADNAPRRDRLKDVAAARFMRLATLLNGLGRVRKTDSTLASLEPHKVVRDAVALAPRRPLYLRRLARWSRARGDLNNCAKSLGTLASAYADRRLRALASAELARTIHIGGGRAGLVDQYLDEALAADANCAPARLAKAYRLLAWRKYDDFDALAASGDDWAIDLDFPDDERALIASEQWAELAQLLETKLESAVEPDDWQRLTFRLAHLHGWYLSPNGDNRLRAEFLEQVLIANPSHIPALVEILDVRLARREYSEAAEVTERLVELAVEPADEASWLTELGVLVEHYLGTPDWAFDCFEEALRAEPDNVDAFFGLLRTDVASSESAVDGIVERLQRGVAVREGEELALELLLRVDETPEATRALSERFPDHPVWLFVRMCLAVEEGGAVDEINALESLRRMWAHPAVLPLLAVFRRRFRGSTRPSRAELYEQLDEIKSSPLAEGRLVRALYEARYLNDVELLGMLAAIGSRRTPGVVSRATDLTWMAVTLMWRGQEKKALRVCEHVLDRFPDFLPALKLAKLASRRVARWAELVRWCEREAERTEVAQVAFENRTAASEVQRKYLGDFDAACQQFRTVLDANPGHAEAFDKLKPLLLQRGEVGELLALYERRLAHTPEVERKCEMLNEMADIALHRGKNPQAAMEYFERALEHNPGQLRSLRILAELYHENDQIDAALRCYRQAAELTDNDTLNERLWVHIGRLLEEDGRGFEALDAYECALRSNPSQTDIILDIARLEAENGDLETALIHLQRLESTASKPEVLREGRARKARYLVELGRDERQVLSAFRDLLLHHPDDEASVDALCEYMGERNNASELDEFFRALAHQAFEEMQGGRPFAPHFAIAQRLGQTDRAFCLAAVAKALGYSTSEMEEFYAHQSQTRHWPSRALPGDVLDDLIPRPILSSFLALLRQSEPVIRRALDATLVRPTLDGATTLRGPEQADLELATRWPGLYGLELHEVLETAEVDGGSLVCDDGTLRLIVDRRWRSVADPTELLVHLGKQLAGWAMGIGAWQYLDTRTRFIAFAKLVSHLAPGWGGAAASQPLDGLDWPVVEGWLAGVDTGELAQHAQDLSGRLSTQAVEPQFRMVELALERAASLVLDDPCRYFPHTKYLGSEHGMLQQPWTFVFSNTATKMRRRVGVAQG
ncbi:tetratricopeptide repeat protein [Persicimonas caeni]|uniref:Tetratricopeptide repeat protein n=1 Tax=Persicimonas caeni TaxID=2292766 RepID=A0A4Y6Q2K7_PERCE|nr:tetratricopeptide repeat protein [Persicimonas caeni]QDG54796.1 tetratricopeptide repeat protein [Persicimonas caeni]QED36017.1 tetratricopeptide repeat protein [Persicimonas caeni]